MTTRRIAAIVAILAGFSAQAADKVKVGFLSTLSGPGSGLGVASGDG